MEKERLSFLEKAIENVYDQLKSNPGYIVNEISKVGVDLKFPKYQNNSNQNPPKIIKYLKDYFRVARIFDQDQARIMKQCFGDKILNWLEVAAGEALTEKEVNDNYSLTRYVWCWLNGL